MDISPVLQSPNYWEAQTFAQASGSGGTGNNIVPFVSGGLQKAASIYNAYVSTVDISSPSGQLNGAALQVAIWSALYGSSFLLTTDGSGPSLVPVTTLVTQMLTTSVNPNLTSTYWNAVDSSGNPIPNQDLIGPQFETGFVPEPGTYAVAASVCAGLGLLVVRRKQGRA